MNEEQQTENNYIITFVVDYEGRSTDFSLPEYCCFIKDASPANAQEKFKTRWEVVNQKANVLAQKSGVAIGPKTWVNIRNVEEVDPMDIEKRLEEIVRCR